MSECYITTIEAVNNCGKTRKVTKLLNYVPLYRHFIPHQADRQRQPRLPPLHICERALRGRCLLSIEVSNLINGTVVELVWLRKEAKGQSIGSSGSSSSDSFDLDDEAISKWVAGVVGGKK
ncbi:hypothetical protein Acr_07g0011200 [Actinidia rufa]|uniref:Uncharacterized protein n=1 Tax=Actinidia rufa TaxID=165716 RepID=A0A7J0EWS2_9ERIC|nr:hypothetical protein Acr_07g0011200 [Actinidia rufa]